MQEVCWKLRYFPIRFFDVHCERSFEHTDLRSALASVRSRVSLVCGDSQLSAAFIAALSHELHRGRLAAGRFDCAKAADSKQSEKTENSADADDEEEERVLLVDCSAVALPSAVHRIVLRGLSAEGISHFIGRCFDEWEACRVATTLMLCLKTAMPVLYKDLRMKFVPQILQIKRSSSLRCAKAEKTRSLLVEAWIKQVAMTPRYLFQICSAVASAPLEQRFTKTKLYKRIAKLLIEPTERKSMRMRAWQQQVLGSEKRSDDVLQYFLAAEYVCYDVPEAEQARLLSRYLNEGGPSCFFQFVCGLGGTVLDYLPDWFPSCRDLFDTMKAQPFYEEVLFWAAEDDTGKVFAHFWPYLDDSQRERALLLACEHGVPAFIVRQILKRINRPNRFAREIWTVGAAITDMEVLKLLRDSNILPANDGRALYGALERGAPLSVVRFIAEELGANEHALRERLPFPPLFRAAITGDKEIFEYVLTLVDTDPFATGADGSTLLHAAALSRNVEIVQIALNYGDSVNVADRFQFTPLMTAIAQDDLESVALMVRQLKEANMPISPSCLLLAATMGLRDIVSLLLDYRVPISERVGGDNTAIDYAVGAMQTSVVELMLERGAQWMISSITNLPLWTPLHCAAQVGAIRFLESRIKSHPSEVHAQGDNKETPLHRAAAQGFLRCVKVLVENGANVNACSDLGTTPLLMAAFASNVPVVSYLCSKGAALSLPETQDSVYHFHRQGASLSNARETFRAAQGADDVLKLFDQATRGWGAVMGTI